MNSYHVSIFPTFYSVDRRATIYQVLAQSFCKDQVNYVFANIPKLSIYLIDSSDMPSISALANDMIMCFPDIRWLNFCFERQCEIVSFFISTYNRT